MRFAVYLPAFGDFADARRVAALAREAEDAGWDAFFLWDHVSASWDTPIADPWIALTAAALATTRIRLGTMVTPLPRRRPWKLARETATLDRLSDGRFILGVGIGIFSEEFEDVGEPKMLVRGEMLDEGLEVLCRLWSGKPFTFAGSHYNVKARAFTPSPVQQPRIPIWVGGAWPNKRPFRRAAKWDGLFAIHPDSMNHTLSPEDFRDIIAYTKQHRSSNDSLEVMHAGFTSGTGQGAGAQLVASYAQAGVNWWAEAVGLGREDRVRLGPPRLP